MSAPARRIFVPAIGQYDNVGDILLRRELLDWLRDEGELHVYLGRFPTGYDAGLDLEPGDVTYRSFVRWYAAAALAALTRPTTYSFKPGEIQLTLPGMKEHLAMLPLLALLRVRGGTSVRVGVGARNRSRVFAALVAPSIALSDLTLWRDGETHAELGGDGVMPDLAFAHRDDSTTQGWDRTTLVVSMRGDRPLPPDAWFDGIRAHAETTGAAIVAVTQVARDDERMRDIAARLGAEHVAWRPGDHRGLESALRDRYRSARLVISDRLHVLVAGVTEGAVPVGTPLSGDPKIARSMRAAHIPTAVIDPRSVDAREMAAALSRVSERVDDVREGLAIARAQLRETRDRLRGAIAGGQRA